MFSKISRAEFQDAINRIAALEIELEKLRTHINSLRGLINRKLGKEAEKEDLKSSDPLERYRL